MPRRTPRPLASRVALGIVAVALVAIASSGCFDVSKLIFDLDGGSTCGKFAQPPASSLVTRFDSDGGMSAGWAAIGGCSTEQGGYLVPAPVAGMASFCKYATEQYYHLVCDELTVKVPQKTTPILGVQTFIYLITEGAADAAVPNGTNVSLLFEAGGFTLASTLSCNAATATYDATNDLWWRLRGLPASDAGSELLEFDTSPDGQTWTSKTALPLPASTLDNVKIELGAGEEEPSGVPNPGQARFACYNVAPSDCPP